MKLSTHGVHDARVDWHVYLYFSVCCCPIRLPPLSRLRSCPVNPLTWSAWRSPRVRRRWHCLSALPSLVVPSVPITGGPLRLNIYTEVGLVTLMGLISKHGILIVQFANQSQLAGMSKREAIEHAAAVRLRPILMTTAAMVLGVLPLVIASGAGAAGRFNMGLVISTGLAIGTVFTLFVVPAFYLLLSTDHHGGEASDESGLAVA